MILIIIYLGIMFVGAGALTLSLSIMQTFYRDSILVTIVMLFASLGALSIIILAINKISILQV